MAMESLNKATQIALDSMWKLSIEESVRASLLLKDEKQYEELLNAMEEGLVAPQPWYLPSPPDLWLH